MINFLMGDKLVQGEPGKALYTYHLASNGIFLAAERPEMEVRMQLAHCELRGAGEPLEELFDWKLPCVGSDVVMQVMCLARHFRMQQQEVACWLMYSPLNPLGNGWLPFLPTQERVYASCTPAPNQPEYERTLIELHSHHVMPAKFSSTDDKDETGFRIYAVVGDLSNKPTIRTRVGIFGQFWEIPSEWVFELPEGLTCANA